ncbi:GTP-binding protein [Thermogemmatispora carboxidivorans]|uniref:GTP-binding protein n=1 Tax=Thermogemmatispora carboxidivorans TaxID=1382306 RepID=UPI00069B667D|nr:GTP-binding protein [Thermogemmatispora carboxidivorans]
MHETRPKLIIAGGFLGAGKTTLLLQAAAILRQRGLRVALVTNDQGRELVDTALAAADWPGEAVAEVTAGCFCCRFSDLLEAIAALERRIEPQVILAEPVGSCTDLQATVILPLLHFYRERYRPACLSIVVDGPRLSHLIRHGDLSLLNDDVAYLFARQIEEGDLLLINKSDLLSSDEQLFLRNWLRAYCPGVPVLPMTARRRESVALWLDNLLQDVNTARVSEAEAHRLDDLDYQRYARAEARLGWLNARGRLRPSHPIGATNGEAGQVLAWATALLSQLQERLARAGLAIAHIKLLVAPQALRPLLSAEPDGPLALDPVAAVAGQQEQAQGRLIKASLCGPGPAAMSWDARSDHLPPEGAVWLLNARVDCSPAVLETHVRAVLAAALGGLRAEIEELSAFQPAPPQPQYRFGPDASQHGAR